MRNWHKQSLNDTNVQQDDDFCCLRDMILHYYVHHLPQRQGWRICNYRKTLNLFSFLIYHLKTICGLWLRHRQIYKCKKREKRIDSNKNKTNFQVIIFIASTWLTCKYLSNCYKIYIYWLTNIHSLNAEEKNNLYQYIQHAHRFCHLGVHVPFYLHFWGYIQIFGGAMYPLTLYLGVQRKLTALSPCKVVHHAVFCKYYTELAKTFFFCLTLGQEVGFCLTHGLCVCPTIFL
jgi:hypothetical protein